MSSVAEAKETNTGGTTSGGFAGLILRHVKACITDSPSTEDVLQLLKLFHPEIKSLNDIESVTLRDTMFEEIRSSIHPNKHMNNPEAIAIFNNLDGFIDKSKLLNFKKRANTDAGSAKKKKRVREEPVVSLFPSVFNIQTKWNFNSRSLRKFLEADCAVNGQVTSASYVYNLRGQAWSYGELNRDITLRHWVNSAAFKRFYRNSTADSFIESIKKEITKRGPVISRSFKPPNVSRPSSESDLPIIIGWTTDDVQGGKWLVLIPSKGFAKFHEVAFHTCSIEDDIAVPEENCRDKEWHIGIYWGINFANDEWRTFASIHADRSIASFMQLWKASGANSMKSLIGKKSNFFFEVHANGAKTISRRAYMTDVEFISETEVKIKMTFT